MRIKATIGVFVFIFGFLLCVGAVGNLDYIDACGEMVSDADFTEAVIRSVIGLICMAAAFAIGKDFSFEADSDAEDVSLTDFNEDEQSDNTEIVQGKEAHYG